MNSQTTIKTILVDIEGTTSSISFVHEVLFPYAQENLENFLQQNSDKDEILSLVNEALAVENIELDNKEDRITSATKLFQTWIKEDKKIKALKELQGYIWESGYKNQDFQGHIYEDAYKKLVEWHELGYKIYIYSSGSVQAQKLLFAHTKFGDINHLFAGNFDTKLGGKKEPNSYQKIIKEMKTSAQETIFLSDNSEELKAANDAGLKTVKLARPEDDIAADPNYTSVHNFTEIKL